MKTVRAHSSWRILGTHNTSLLWKLNFVEVLNGFIAVLLAMFQEKKKSIHSALRLDRITSSLECPHFRLRRLLYGPLK